MSNENGVNLCHKPINSISFNFWCLSILNDLAYTNVLKSVVFLAWYVQQWEILVVAKLRWDLCPVTAIDFVDVLLQQVPVKADTRGVRRHAASFIALAATGSF